MRASKKHIKHRTVLEYLQEIKTREDREICFSGANHNINGIRKDEKQNGNI